MSNLAQRQHVPSRYDLTPGLIDKFRNLLATGIHLQTAANKLNIPPSTVFHWYRRGKGLVGKQQPAKVFVAFAEAIDRGRAECECLLVSAFMKDALGGSVTSKTTTFRPDGTVVETERRAPPNGRLALDGLARKYSKRWSKPSAPLVGVNQEGGSITIQQLIHQANNGGVEKPPENRIELDLPPEDVKED
jgi:hypothetical protein